MAGNYAWIEQHLRGAIRVAIEQEYPSQISIIRPQTNRNFLEQMRALEPSEICLCHPGMNHWTGSVMHRFQLCILIISTLHW